MSDDCWEWENQKIITEVKWSARGVEYVLFVNTCHKDTAVKMAWDQCETSARPESKNAMCATARNLLL